MHNRHRPSRHIIRHNSRSHSPGSSSSSHDHKDANRRWDSTPPPTRSRRRGGRHHHQIAASIFNVTRLKIVIIVVLIIFGTSIIIISNILMTATTSTKTTAGDGPFHGLATSSSSSWTRDKNQTVEREISAPLMPTSLLTTTTQPTTTPTFTIDEFYHSLLTNNPLIPSSQYNTCRKYAEKFHQTQKRNSEQQSQRRLVLVCHRKWCGGSSAGGFFGGTCHPGGGVGTRFRSMLNLASLAISVQNIKVEFDIPTSLHPQMEPLRIVEDAYYEDPWGRIAEWFHFRSYGNDVVDTSRRQFDIHNYRHEWGLDDIDDNNNSDNNGTYTSVRGQQQQPQQQQTYYLHATPDKYLNDPTQFIGGIGGLGKIQYHPCLFHTIFQPSQRLWKDFHVHWNRIIDNMGNNKDAITKDDDADNSVPTVIIGIHFRTGDANSFNMSNRDQRLSNNHKSLMESLDALLDCAKAAASKWKNDADHDDDHDANHNSTNKHNNNNNNVKYFLATDNQRVKDIIQDHPERYSNVYTTMGLVPPVQSWQDSNGDYYAWLEIMLLAKCHVLVANRRVEGRQQYKGRSDAISTFIRLAATIGFHGTMTMKDDNNNNNNHHHVDGTNDLDLDSDVDVDVDSHIKQCYV